jgi:hypothetical protein
MFTAEGLEDVSVNIFLDFSYTGDESAVFTELKW